MTGLLVTIKFAGGCELLFNDVKLHTIRLPENPDGEPAWTIASLLVWMKTNMKHKRPEFFFHENTVRPGILVLVNEQDWELLGELDYKIQYQDHITFISTLHGG